MPQMRDGDARPIAERVSILASLDLTQRAPTSATRHRRWMWAGITGALLAVVAAGSWKVATRAPSATVAEVKRPIEPTQAALVAPVVLAQASVAGATVAPATNAAVAATPAAAAVPPVLAAASAPLLPSGTTPVGTSPARAARAPQRAATHAAPKRPPATARRDIDNDAALLDVLMSHVAPTGATHARLPPPAAKPARSKPIDPARLQRLLRRCDRLPATEARQCRRAAMAKAGQSARISTVKAR